jgi:hypothetical protein
MPFFTLHAQVSIACQGGINFANLYDHGILVPGAVWSTQRGVAGLLSVDLPIGAGFSVSPGIRFVQKGTRSDYSYAPYGDFAINAYLNYLEVPIDVKFALTHGPIRISLLVGESIGYLVSARAEGTITSEGNVSFDVRGQYQPYTCCVDAGVECVAPVSGPFAVVGSAEYSLGLTGINKAMGDTKTKDIRVMLGVAYAFGEW